MENHGIDGPHESSTAVHSLGARERTSRMHRGTPEQYRPTNRNVPTGSRQLPLALNLFDGRTLLIHAKTPPASTPEQTLSALRLSLDEALTAHSHESRLTKLFTTTKVGIARVQHIMSWDLDTPCQCCRISLEDLEPSVLLTEAFHHPKLFSRGIESFGIDTLPLDDFRDIKGQKVIVVQRIFDRGRIAAFLIVLLGVSPVVGIIVGVCSHRSEVGVAVSAGVFALASFLQGHAAWLQG